MPQIETLVTYLNSAILEFEDAPSKNKFIKNFSKQTQIFLIQKLNFTPQKAWSTSLELHPLVNLVPSSLSNFLKKMEPPIKFGVPKMFVSLLKI